MSYPDAAWERAMTVQEVMLKAARHAAHDLHPLSDPHIYIGHTFSSRGAAPTWSACCRMNCSTTDLASAGQL